MNTAVIIPAYNASTTLDRCLQSIRIGSRQPDLLIVVDDGSTDGTAEVGQRGGATVLRPSDEPMGPAAARNHGAQHAADMDLLIFFDADTLVHTDTIDRIRSCFLADAGIDALFGSYDLHPEAPNIASQYKNLLHHFVHHTSNADAATFWAGCGAMKRQAFMSSGGFSRRYTRPSVEDIDLGMRLRRHGFRIRSCPDVQVTHLKRWSLWGLWKTDVLQRAVPWTRLIIEEGRLVDDLNVSVRNRLSAASCLLCLLSMGGAALISPLFWGLAAVAATVFIVLTWNLVRLFYCRGGLKLALGGAVLHFLHNIYSSLTFGTMVIADRLSRVFRRRRKLRETEVHGAAGEANSVAATCAKAT